MELFFRDSDYKTLLFLFSVNIWIVWKKYEGRGKKRCGEVRTDEVRKWDEGPRGEVDLNEVDQSGNGDPH